MFSSRKTGSASNNYLLTRSLRFRSSASAYLNRTPASAGNRKTMTFSFWVKRGFMSSTQQNIISAGTGSDNYIAWSSTNDYIEMNFRNGGSASNVFLITTQVFRDPSAWYHIVLAIDTTQATASNRVKLYVNGSQVTAFGTTTYPTQNNDLNAFNNNVIHHIGQSGVGGFNFYLDGYLTEINFIDGQQLNPSSFGETSAATGVWQPIKYTGTYGTNGFYLPFTDVATTSGSNAGLGKDFSGNSNYWTTNNISVTSGSTYDSMTDVPTLTSATAANYATWNPIEPNAALGGGTTEANLLGYPSNTANTGQLKATINFPTTGKFYFEITPTVLSSATAIIGILKSSIAVGTSPSSAGDMYAYQSDGNKYNGSATAAYGASYTVNDVIGVAFDIGGGTITFYKNGVSQGQAYTGITGEYIAAVRDGTAGGVTQYAANFGQRPFAYTPPTGFVALNTFNLPTPTIGASSASQANKYMDISLYTGTGSSQSITGLNFQPDWTWIKGRSGATDHGLYDAVRGVQQQLESNTTTDETTESTGLTAFGSDGFTVGSLAQVNTNNDTYVAWCWKESTTSKFDIVTYTGNGTARTISHNLGVVPNMIIVKARTTASTDQGWPVYHSANTANPETDYLLLNTTAATADLDTVWNDTAPTSSVFSVGTNALVNANNDTYVAYLFANVAGYSAFGSYTGNGSSDGPFVFTGFRPRFLMIKRTSGTPANWYMWDSSRSPFNAAVAELYPNLSNAEANGSNDFDFLSNGFKTRNTTDAGINGSGETFIYMAFAESPFKYANAR